MFEELRPIIPTSEIAVEEILATHQLRLEFDLEVQYRQEFERYCQWYYATAQQHQQEMERMQGELNILGWFLRKRPS